MAEPRELSGNEKGCLGCLVGGIFAVFVSVIVYVFVAGASGSAGGTQAAPGSGAQAAAPPSATSAAASPAQMLADLDSDKQPVTAYQAALDALAPKCTQDEYHIAALGNSGYGDLEKNGVKDETRLTVLQHLDASIPAGLGKTDCAGMLAAYLTLRETG